jgi:hypothetical protein
MEIDQIVRVVKNLSEINFDEDQLIDLMNDVKFPDWILVEIQKLNDEYIPV